MLHAMFGMSCFSNSNTKRYPFPSTWRLNYQFYNLRSGRGGGGRAVCKIHLLNDSKETRADTHFLASGILISQISTSHLFFSCLFFPCSSLNVHTYLGAALAFRYVKTLGKYACMSNQEDTHQPSVI